MRSAQLLLVVALLAASSAAVSAVVCDKGSYYSALQRAPLVPSAINCSLVPLREVRAELWSRLLSLCAWQLVPGYCRWLREDERLS